jgi:hypothetical protein
MGAVLGSQAVQFSGQVRAGDGSLDQPGNTRLGASAATVSDAVDVP